MAHVQKRGNGKYRARYRGPDHKERSKTFRRKIDAENFLAAIVASKSRGDWTDPALARITVGEWAEQWFGSRTNLKPKTIATYRSLLDSQVLPVWAKVPLADVQHLNVAEWVTKMMNDGLSASRTRQAYNVLTAMLAGAVLDRRLPRNAARGVALPRLPKCTVVACTHEQVQRLAAVAGAVDGLMILLLAYCGLRWGEAAGLRCRRVDLVRGRLEVAESLSDVNGTLVFGPPKSHETRYVPIPKFLCDALAIHIANLRDDDLVFTAPRGGPLRYRAWRRRTFDPARHAVGLPRLLPHHLRHTCASLLIAGGAHPKHIQTMLGHASITTTLDRYGHLYGDELDQLAAGLDLASAHARGLAAAC